MFYTNPEGYGSVYVDPHSFKKYFPNSDDSDIDRVVKFFESDGVNYCPYCCTIDNITNLANDIEHHKAECNTGHFDRFFWKYSIYTVEEYRALSDSGRALEYNFLRDAYEEHNNKIERGPRNYDKDEIIYRYGYKIARDLRINPFRGEYYESKYFL